MKHTRVDQTAEIKGILAAQSIQGNEMPPQERAESQSGISARATLLTLQSLQSKNAGGLDPAAIRALIDLGFVDSLPSHDQVSLRAKILIGEKAAKAIYPIAEKEPGLARAFNQHDRNAQSALFYLTSFSWLGSGVRDQEARIARDLGVELADIRRQKDELLSQISTGKAAKERLVSFVTVGDECVKLSDKGEELIRRLQPRSTLLSAQSLEEIVLAMKTVDSALHQKVQVALELKEYFEQSGVKCNKPGMLENLFALSNGKLSKEDTYKAIAEIELQLTSSACTPEQRFYIATLLVRSGVDPALACKEISDSAQIISQERSGKRVEYLDIYTAAMLLGAGNAETVKSLYQRGQERAKELVGGKKTGGFYHLAARLGPVSEEIWDRCKEIFAALPSSQVSDKYDGALVALTLAGTPLASERSLAIFQRCRDLLLEERLISSKDGASLAAAVAAHPGAVDPRVAVLKELSAELVGLEKSGARRLALSYILFQGVEDQLSLEKTGLGLTLIGGVSKETGILEDASGSVRRSNDSFSNTSQFNSGSDWMPLYLCMAIDDGGSSVNAAAPCGSSSPGSHGAHCGSGHSSSDSGAAHCGSSSGASSCSSSSGSSCGGGGGSSCGGGGSGCGGGGGC